MIITFKNRKMKTMETLKNLKLLALFFMAFAVVSCNDDDDAPEEEDEVEVITNLTLVFSNIADSQDVVRATAIDPDGLGVQELVVQDEITLTAGAAYLLTFEIQNALDPNDVEDIGEEILEEDDEHQFFFGFTEGAFTSPSGNGNIDSSADPINYDDQDEDGNPVGLTTTWSTATQSRTGDTFRVVLQHQPDIKSGTTGANDGETDIDVTFVLNIE